MVVIVIGVLFLLLAIGVPVFMALIVPTAILVLNSPAIADIAVVQRMFFGLDRITLMAIPFFIFCAGVMSAGQIADRISTLARAFCGHLSGGMAIATVTACLLFGAITGVGTTTIVAIGGIMYSLMMSGKYDEKFSAGLILSSSTFGMILPPSVPYMLFALASGTSIAALFLSGLSAGLIMGITLLIYCFVYSKIKKLPVLEKTPWNERWKAAREAFFSLFLIVIIMGGIYGGVFTVTESAAVAAFYAIFIEVVVYRSIKLKDLTKVALQSGKTIAMVMMLIAAGGSLAWAMSVLRIPHMVAALLGGMSDLAAILIINAIFFIASLFLDPNSTILIFVPLVLEAASVAGIHPIHLGTMVIVNMCIGMITPPVALNLYVGVSVFKKPFEFMVRAAIPFVITFLCLLVVFIFVPPLSTWLPSALL